jgi:hypothetical protein
MRKIAEVIAATLTVLALWGGHVRGAPACMTKEGLGAQIDQTAPRYDLTGIELELFNKHFKEQSGLDPPENIDEIVVFTAQGGANVFALVATLQKDCIVKAIVVPLEEFLTVYQGEKG